MCISSRGDKKNRYTVVHTGNNLILLTTLSTCAYVEVIVFFFLRMDPSDNVDIDLVKCRAYEVVKLSRQGITMNENPAYGEIGVIVHVRSD